MIIRFDCARRPLARAIAFLILGAVVTGCGPSAKEKEAERERADTLAHEAAEKARHERDRAALVDVYRQVKAVEKECTIVRGNRKQVNMGRVFTLYNKLDTSKCPQDFRLAWFDYLTAWQAQRHHQGELLLEAGAALMTAGATSAALVGKAVTTADQAVKDDPALAVRAVKRFWVQYDISEKDL